MSKYGEWVDRIAWELICTKIAEKQCLNKYKLTPTALTRRLITFGGRGCGKTLTMKFVAKQINELYNKSLISVRWCECFEILDNRKRRVCYVHLAKI